MNSNLIDLHKILYPEKYETKYIYTYPTFNDELAVMISKSGYVNEFKTKYYKSLRFLEKLKRNCIQQSRLFERLKEEEGLYSIRLWGKKNIRILFSFEEVDDDEKAILYYCFQEKDSKDYNDSIRIAKARRNKIIC